MMKQKCFGISEEEIEKFWNEYLVKYVTTYRPREFAKKVIDILKEENEIYIITSRNEYGLPLEYKDNMQDFTKTWLYENDIYYDKLIFSPEDKVDICKKNNIDIMIEDRPINIERLSKAGVLVICYDNPYNKNCDGENIVRGYSWYDILNKIKTHEKNEPKY